MTILKCFSSAGTVGRNYCRRLFERMLFRQACISVSDELNHVTAFTRCYAKKTRSNVKKFPQWHAFSETVFNEFLEVSKVEGFKLNNEFIKLEENLEKFTGYGKGNIRFQIINLITLSKNVGPELTLHYIDYLKNKSFEISQPALLRAIQCVTPQYPNEGLEWIYEYLKKTPLEVISIHCLITLIENMLYTKDWKYGIEIIDRNFNSIFASAKTGEKNSFNSLTGKVLLTALANQDVETYNTFLEKYWSHLRMMGGEVISAATNMIEAGRISPEICFEVFKASQLNHRIFFDQAQELRKTLEKYWSDSVKIEFVEMSNKSCTCLTCGEELQKPQFTVEELKKLEKCFIRMAVNDGRQLEANLLRGLLSYLQNHGPFDVVVDTLNLTNGVTGPNCHNIIKEKQKLIASELGIPLPKMLLIDPHSAVGQNTLPKGVNVFSFMGRKRCYKGFDDILVIIAALNSGSNTYFLSEDLFRDHVSSDSLSREEYFTFKAWRQSRQIKRTKDGVEMPNPFVITTQGTDGGWHVPFSIPFGIEIQAIRTHEFPDRFMCIQKMKNWKPSPMYLEFVEDMNRISNNRQMVELEKS